MVQRNFLIIILAIFTSGAAFTQEVQKLTLEDIYQNNVFKINSVQGLSWMKDGNLGASKPATTIGGAPVGWAAEP